MTMFMNKDKMTRLSIDQKEMRSVFLGGFAGQLVSGLIWITAATTSALSHVQHGMLVLFFGCMSIFPMTQLLLRIMGRPAKVDGENGLWALGPQIAFTVPLNFLLVGALTFYRPLLFFPASMIVVGTHYLPFITLYGMKMFGILSAILISIGIALALYGPPIFSLGGWLTGLILIIFAFMGKSIVIREEKQETRNVK